MSGSKMSDMFQLELQTHTVGKGWQHLRRAVHALDWARKFRLAEAYDDATRCIGEAKEHVARYELERK